MRGLQVYLRRLVGEPRQPRAVAYIRYCSFSLRFGLSEFGRSLGAMMDVMDFDVRAHRVYPGMRVRVNVESAVNPNTIPRRIVKNNCVANTQKVRVRPSPWGKTGANYNSGTKPYRT